MENQNPKQQQSPIAETPVSHTLPVSQPPQTSPVIQKASKFSIKAVIGTIMFLLLAGGAAAGYVYREPLMKLVSNPTPTPSPFPATITPTPNPITNWQIYTNSEYKYSFSYPSEIFNEPQVISSPDQVLVSGKNINTPWMELSITVAPMDSHNALLYSDWCEKNGNEFTRNGHEYCQIFYSQSTPKGPIIFGKNTANRNLIIFNRNNDEVVATQFITQENTDLINYEDTFNQIFSTFKFTDSEAVDTSNWKTYTGTEFSFKHPPESIIGQAPVTKALLVQHPSAYPNTTSDQNVYKQIYVLGIGQEDNPKNMTIDQYIESLIKPLESQTEPGPSEARSARESIHEEKFANFSATSVTIGHSGKVETLYVLRNNKIYSITMRGAEYEPYPEAQAVMDKILSTFKFTD